MTQALTQARRGGQLVAILFLDLDDFKLINDTLGHAIGDRLLITVAERLKTHVREADTIARHGGDEFMLLFPGLDRVEDVTEPARRILQAFKAPFYAYGRELYTTASLGVSFYPDDGESVEALVRNADIAMYRAKERGKNNYQFFTAAMHSIALQRLALEDSLRHALDRREFEVYYQPQVNIRNGRIFGMEALVRWQHPEQGLVYPEGFIQSMEESGLILPLGEWVLRTACAQAKAWQEAMLPSLRVAVNLSARQFQQPDLVAMIAQILRETELEGRHLELEVTESVAVQNPDRTAAILGELAAMGISIALDDFGTGHAFLSYLKRFPLHTLKIDHIFYL